jgi:DNA replication and checkpoint protein
MGMCNIYKIKAETSKMVFLPLRRSLARLWSGSGDRSANDAAPTGVSIPKPLSSGMSTRTVQSEVSTISFADLKSRKRELREQLKQYDVNFARKHGRMPVKIEKEPIRYLYEAYNSLKNQMWSMEEKSRSPSASISSTALSGSIGNKSNSSLLAKSKRKLPKAVVPSSLTVGTTSPAVGSAAASATTWVFWNKSITHFRYCSQGAADTDLTSLKAEQKALYRILKAYENDFVKEHGRQVSQMADICPVASQYRRYKDIKAIVSMHGGGILMD